MLTYGIFLFLSIFPIIHPKGLAQMPEENMENTKLLPLGTEQGLEETEYCKRRRQAQDCAYTCIPCRLEGSVRLALS